MQDKWRDDIKLENFEPNELIPLIADSFWWLDRGIVKSSTWNDEGTPVTLGYWGANDVVGQPLSIRKPYQLKCMTPVKAFCVPATYSECLTDSIRNHIQQTEELLYIMRADKMYERLVNLLNWLASRFSIEREQGRLIEIRLTHQELAEAIGTTRVTITKLIKQLEDEGMISRPYRNSILLKSSI